MSTGLDQILQETPHLEMEQKLLRGWLDIPWWCLLRACSASAGPPRHVKRLSID